MTSSKINANFASILKEMFLNSEVTVEIDKVENGEIMGANLVIAKEDGKVLIFASTENQKITEDEFLWFSISPNLFLTLSFALEPWILPRIDANFVILQFHWKNDDGIFQGIPYKVLIKWWGEITPLMSCVQGPDSIQFSSWNFISYSPITDNRKEGDRLFEIYKV